MYAWRISGNKGSLPYDQDFPKVLIDTGIGVQLDIAAYRIGKATEIEYHL